MRVRFLYNFLFINDCKEILFPFHISGLIPLENIVIVFISASTVEEAKLLPTTNIYAFDENANQVWQIEESFQPSGRRVCYADISLKKNGDIVAGTSMGTEYLVNIKDGSITPHNTDKRPW